MLIQLILHLFAKFDRLQYDRKILSIKIAKSGCISVVRNYDGIVQIGLSVVSAVNA